MDYIYQLFLMSFKCDKINSIQAHIKMYPHIHIFCLFVFYLCWKLPSCLRDNMFWKVEKAIPSINDPWYQEHYFNEYLNFIFWNPKAIPLFTLTLKLLKKSHVWGKAQPWDFISNWLNIQICAENSRKVDISQF